MAQQTQLKTNLTNNTYQSQFLPLVEKAAMTIKKLVVYFAINNISVFKLRVRIRVEIDEFEKRLPIDLIDRELYVNALKNASERMIRTTYTAIINKFVFFSSFLVGLNLTKKKFDSPKELLNYVNKLTPAKVKEIDQTLKQDLWSAKKGAPRIEYYGKQLKDQLNGLAKTEIAPHEEGKKPITVWQKAELDIRYEHQMEMVKELKDDGYILCWISTHPDCSKRCEKWQGKLVDIQNHAKLSGFRMDYKVDGHTVYSLTDIIAQTDKYGYHNNIINGFNCRHHLIPYKRGSVAPVDYANEDIAKERKINANLRRMERDIRKLKQRAELLKFVDTKESKLLYNKAEQLTKRYKHYATSNGFAWYQYRIQA